MIKPCITIRIVPIEVGMALVLHVNRNQVDKTYKIEERKRFVKKRTSNQAILTAIVHSVSLKS